VVSVSHMNPLDSMKNYFKNKRKDKVLKEYESELSQKQSENQGHANTIKRREKDIEAATKKFNKDKNEWLAEIRKEKAIIKKNNAKISRLQSAIATLRNQK